MFSIDWGYPIYRPHFGLSVLAGYPVDIVLNCKCMHSGILSRGQITKLTLLQAKETLRTTGGECVTVFEMGGVTVFEMGVSLAR